MLNRILENLQTYFGDEYKLNLFTLLVNKAIANVKVARNYPDNYTDAMIQADLEQFEYKIFDIVINAYNKIGIEGEYRHTENGMDATFIDEKELYNGIVPFARVV